MGRQFPSQLPVPSSIVNAYSDGGGQALLMTARNAKGILSGALTANVYKSLLSVTGRGRLRFIGARQEDTTSRQVGLKLTIDGTIVFQALGAVSTQNGGGVVAVGTMNAVDYGQESDGVYFNHSFSVEVSSTITETDKVSARVNYEVFR